MKTKLIISTLLALITTTAFAKIECAISYTVGNSSQYKSGLFSSNPFLQITPEGGIRSVDQSLTMEMKDDGLDLLVIVDGQQYDEKSKALITLTLINPNVSDLNKFANVTRLNYNPRATATGIEYFRTRMSYPAPEIPEIRIGCRAITEASPAIPAITK